MQMQHKVTADPDVPLRSILPREIQAAETNGSGMGGVPSHRTTNDALDPALGGDTDAFEGGVLHSRLLKRKQTLLEHERHVHPSAHEGEERLPERAQNESCLESMQYYGAEDLRSVLSHLDEEFAAKERLSREQAWCTPVSHARKVSTVQGFYKAFQTQTPCQSGPA